MITNSPSIPFTEQMFLSLDKQRREKMLSRDELISIMKISWRATIQYWKKTGRISYKMVRKLLKIWIHLTS